MFPVSVSRRVYAKFFSPTWVFGGALALCTLVLGGIYLYVWVTGMLDDTQFPVPQQVLENLSRGEVIPDAQPPVSALKNLSAPADTTVEPPAAPPQQALDFLMQ